jgi:hypothetical protein
MTVQQVQTLIAEGWTALLWLELLLSERETRS